MWDVIIPTIATLLGIASERYIQNRKVKRAAQAIVEGTKGVIPERFESSRRIAEQAIIAANLDRANRIAAEIDRQRAAQKADEAEALARGRANALPDVEIADPHEEE
jgi:ribosomal protein S17E